MNVWQKQALLYNSKSAFSPLSLSGLQVWLRSDMGITLNGSNVSAWADQSGVGNNVAQGTALNQPAFTTNAVNGLPAVTGNGGNTFLVRNALINSFTDCTIYIVYNFVNSNGVCVELVPTGGFSTQGISLYHLTGTTITGRRLNTPQAIAQSTPTGWSFATYKSQNIQGDLFLDGGSQNTNPTVLTMPTENTLTLLNATFPGVFGMDGSIAEVIITNTITSTLEDTNVDNYISARYNI